MDAIISRPLSRLTPPPGFEPSPCGHAGAMTMHANPFDFGLDIALPQPAATFVSWFSGGVPARAPRGDTFSSFGAFDPFPGGATNPFSFGFDFDLAQPPLAGAYDPFSGGAAVHAYEPHGNPFVADPCDDLPPPSVFDPFPTWAAADIDLAPANTAAASPRTPGSGNPFTTDGAAAISMDVPVPWEWDDDLYNGNDQPAVDDDGARKSSMTTSHPQLCASYDDDDDDDVEAILRAQEEDAKTRPSPDYLETTQGGRMGPEARATLVCWMIGLCRRYDLAAGTLHRAVSYADRFLSARPLAAAGDATERRRLNLLGAAAVYAAAKYDDQAAAHRLSAGAGEIARRGGFAAGKGEVAAMERELLAALGYRLGAPTAHTFVEHFTRGHYGQEEEGYELQCRAHGFANVSLLHYGCLELRPSAVAAAAVSLAMRAMKPSYRRVVTLDRELEELTGYKPKDLERGVEAIRSLTPKNGGGNGFDIDNFAMFYADPD